MLDVPVSSSSSHEHTNHHRVSLKRSAKLLNCGLTSGLAQAYVFNPWDRALYLSVKYSRPFLNSQNFVNPMAGVTQTVAQRAISAGLYFPLEEIFAELIDDYEEDCGGDDLMNKQIKQWKMFLSGTCAGIINGIVMNPFTRIKVSSITLILILYHSYQILH